jgi:cyclophilin family peptidyl-prolyl cis-trans isomerase
VSGGRALAVLLGLAAVAIGGCDDGGGNAAPAAQESAAPAAAPEGDTLSVSVKPAATEVTLGEAIVLQVTITNGTTEKRRVNVPRLDRNCATVRVRREGDDPYVLEKLHADLDPRTGQLKWKMPEAKELGPGESVTGEMSLTAAQTGKHHMTVAYRHSVRETARNAAPVEITVKPDGAKEGLGIRMETSKGGLTVRLRPDIAPNTVESFASLARDGFFDGLTFHRIVKGFMAQGGDPQGTGAGGPGYFLPLEANRELLHDRGVLSMARTSLPDTAGSQFFLLFTKYPSLDPGAAGPGYTTFGETVEGQETLDALEAVETEIPKAVREQIEARGMSDQQVRMLVERGAIEVSSPVEKVSIESVRLVTLD